MDEEAGQQCIKEEEEEEDTMSSGLKRFLTVTNCFLIILGTTGGPMIARLYFNRGGHRQWLSGFLGTAGWPVIFLPLAATYHRRSRLSGRTKPLFLITPRIFLACAVLGLMTGLNDFCYAYGLSFLPVSTSAILTSTQLAFTAFFAFLVVRQRFTAYSINAVALLTVGAAVLGLHTSTDRPEGVSKAEYSKGFVLTLGASALYGLVLPLVELTYAKAKQAITYPLVMEMQLVISLFATVFCTVGMWINNDFKCFFLGAVGVIFCINTLLAGIIIAVFIPVTEVLGVIFFHEKFSSEKGVALALSLWGLASYSYGEYKEWKEMKASLLEAQTASPPMHGT